MEITVGSVFWQLTVIKEMPTRLHGHRAFLCKCICGKTALVQANNLKSEMTKSCGCRHATQGGQYRSRLYRKWEGMRSRCYLKSDKDYENYGGRGIKVCDRWKKFKKFRDDMEPTYFEGATIERIDVDRDYTPKNCKWATVAEQNRNRRDNIRFSINGETKTLGEWADERGIKRETAYWRNKQGWSIDKILTPVV